MRNFLLLFCLLFSASLFAGELDVSGYAGAGVTHRTIDQQTGDGAQVYAGFVAGEKIRPQMFFVEFRAEQYSVSVVDADQLGMHFIGSIFQSAHNQILLDLGVNYAEYMVGDVTASKTFGSYGLGYRFHAGPVAFRVSYEVEAFDEVDGIKLDSPRKTTAGIEYIF